MKIITNTRFLTIILLISLVLSTNLICAPAILARLSHPNNQIINSVEKQLIAEGRLQGKINKLGTRDHIKMSKKRFKNGLRSYLPALNGFAALYGGFINYSDKNGLISFPLLHKEEKIYLVITANIKPNIIYGNTISHLTLLPEPKRKKVYAQIYLLEKIEEKPEKKPAADTTPKEEAEKEAQPIWYWKVTKQKIPKNNTINALSFVLLTRPKNIYFPVKDSITSELKHLVLPPMYVLNDESNDKLIMNLLDITRYFEPISTDMKSAKEDTVNQVLIKNL